MTFRAVETLKNVPMIAAEDTRHSRKLLSHYEISTPLIAILSIIDLPGFQK